MSSDLPKIEKTVHLLSKRSIALDRDTFIFWWSRRLAATSRLIAGLNQKRTPVTGATLHRWLRLLDPTVSKLEIRPATILKAGVLSYIVLPRDPADQGCVVSPSDHEPLPPGDYGLFDPPTSESVKLGKPLGRLPGNDSFEDIRAVSERCYPPEEIADIVKRYTFTPSLEESVRLRDRKCFITGTEQSSEVDVGISWIFPPAWGYLLEGWRDPRTYDPTPFITPSNAGLMRQDLIPLFHNNAFGIDVDDDCRIVAFKDLGAVTLPSRLPRKGDTSGSVSITNLGPADNFLREHFRWCLMVNLTGGDIREDYDHNDILNYMESLGVAGDIDRIEMAPLDDERWATPLGREIWEDLMRSKISTREDESESEAE